MHRAAARLLRRPSSFISQSRPQAVAQSQKRFFRLGASTLFAASAATTTTSNTSIPLANTTSASMNGNAENVASLVNGQSKKMHSKVVGLA